MKQKLINDLVLLSPNFNQYYFEHWDEIYEQQHRAAMAALDRGRAILEEKKRLPRYLICQSTNLSKISALKKATKISLFGILGAGDIGKTYKCNNCGSKF